MAVAVVGVVVVVVEWAAAAGAGRHCGGSKHACEDCASPPAGGGTPTSCMSDACGNETVGQVEGERRRGWRGRGAGKRREWWRGRWKTASRAPGVADKKFSPSI